MDEKYLEMAGALAEGEVGAGVAVCASRAFPKEDLKPEKYLRTTCVECEEPLPEFRMQKGLTRCTYCQSAAEKLSQR